MLVTGRVAILTLAVKEYHVSTQGDNRHEGTLSEPFLIITKKAQVTCPSDEIMSGKSMKVLPYSYLTNLVCLLVVNNAVG